MDDGIYAFIYDSDSSDDSGLETKRFWPGLIFTLPKVKISSFKKLFRKKIKQLFCDDCRRHGLIQLSKILCFA